MRNIELLKGDAFSLVARVDENDKILQYIIAHDFSPDKPDGDQWAHGDYYGLNLTDAMAAFCRKNPIAVTIEICSRDDAAAALKRYGIEPNKENVNFLLMRVQESVDQYSPVDDGDIWNLLVNIIEDGIEDKEFEQC